MKIKTAIDKKEKLEKEIQKLLNKYQQETKLEIKDISFDGFDCIDEDTQYISEVNVKVEL
ncbi:hypothetical protein [Arcobacter arenosus]|uniref:Uncharacterized protein n=1 Tax=Arcobacter arenosus TaxID=2576037 RepID=A0A5R8Y4S0_9BACT|nr:hypothetical protein [Arcobacter arenosus]TLP41075.1 hypothetical protein FDK22_03375 [Arcobacter arenosus]